MDQSKWEGEIISGSVPPWISLPVLEVRGSSPLSSAGPKPYVVSLSSPFINAAEQTPLANTFFLNLHPAIADYVEASVMAVLSCFLLLNRSSEWGYFAHNLHFFLPLMANFIFILALREVKKLTQC